MTGGVARTAASTCWPRTRHRSTESCGSARRSRCSGDARERELPRNDRPGEGDRGEHVVLWEGLLVSGRGDHAEALPTHRVGDVGEVTHRVVVMYDRELVRS